jgi:ring-1,2-phenylacetyl-CoA epoxidase subunit PaaD
VVTNAGFTRAEAFAILEQVPDPEVPVLSVVELGVVRDIQITDADVTVSVTPTYSGCPALRVIEEDIVTALEARTDLPVHVRTVYSPAWTTDWMSDQAREKLRAYGIAPPGPAPGPELVTITPRAQVVRCPYCDSRNTELKSEFGSTACKSILYCKDCRQPFEQFKAI